MKNARRLPVCYIMRVIKASYLTEILREKRAAEYWLSYDNSKRQFAWQRWMIKLLQHMYTADYLLCGRHVTRRMRRLHRTSGRSSPTDDAINHVSTHNVFQLSSQSGLSPAQAYDGFSSP